MSSPLFVLAAFSTEASEWHHSIWQQMLSATIPQKYGKTFFNDTVFDLVSGQPLEFEVFGRSAALLRTAGQEAVWAGHQVSAAAFRGVPDRLMRKRLYLDFTGHKRNSKGMDQFVDS